MNSSEGHTIFVTGGAGYVGAVLVPKLLDAGYRVKVLDWYIYGEDVLPDHPNLEEHKGDIRDEQLVEQLVRDSDAVIHLACISNDPSYELDPELGKTINYDAFKPLVKLSEEHDVQRFVYVSSSSVYGVKDEPDVTEDLELEPLTDYSKYKAKCEEYLLEERDPAFEKVVFRPATVCGYSPRMRLDLTVNILTNHAVNKGEITVFGGDQLRPNIHIEDITDVYVNSLEWPTDKIDGEIFNAGYQNHSVMRIAEIVKEVVGEDVDIEVTDTVDNRSYEISSKKIKDVLGYEPSHTIQDAVRDLVDAFEAGKIPDPFENDIYSNIDTMKKLDLKEPMTA
ncbi:MAG: NAD-dependent epimerase/dehydratase family protein [bacterium]